MTAAIWLILRRSLLGTARRSIAIYTAFRDWKIHLCRSGRCITTDSASEVLARWKFCMVNTPKGLPAPTIRAAERAVEKDSWNLGKLSTSTISNNLTTEQSTCSCTLPILMFLPSCSAISPRITWQCCSTPFKSTASTIAPYDGLRVHEWWHALHSRPKQPHQCF